MEKYQAEQKTLSEEVEQIESKLSAVKQDRQDVEEYIRRLKKYADVPELAREIFTFTTSYLISRCRTR